MSRRSPFEYDISVSADKARRSRPARMTGAFQAGERRCDHRGCNAIGAYRAPQSPDNLDNYFWFCLEHVRKYNRGWNYFRDHSDEELDAQVDADRLWDRPTWRFGEAAGDKRINPHTDGKAWARFGFSDIRDALGENGTINPGENAGQGAPVRERRLPGNERKALNVLGARDDMKKSEIRALYKDLVKSLHPDRNDGRRDDEERLQEVFWAWNQIKGSRSFRP